MFILQWLMSLSFGFFVAEGLIIKLWSIVSEVQTMSGCVNVGRTTKADEKRVVIISNDENISHSQWNWQFLGFFFSCARPPQWSAWQLVIKFAVFNQFFFFLEKRQRSKITKVSCHMQYPFFAAIYLASNQAFGKTEFYGFLNVKKVKTQFLAK